MCGISTRVRIGGVDLMAEFELQVLELLEHQNHLITSIYSFIAYFFILVVGGFVVYIMLKPLWFFIKKY